MNVLVDTPIWSLALRRKRRTSAQQDLVDELSELIREMRAELIGPIRQEVLSGISDESQFHAVQRRLQPFDDMPVDTSDYGEAAVLFNVCRRKGIQGSHTDFLICAVAVRHSLSVFTDDRDFALYAKHRGVQLHQPR